MNTLNSPRDSILLESGTNEVEFIEFYLGKISYGINVSKVQRVLARTSVSVTKVAQAPHGTIGLIHIHEQPIMLMDLKRSLGINAESVEHERQLILVTTFNKQTTAFLIDGISKIHRTSWGNFVPLNQSVTSEGSGGFSTGTVTFDDNIIVILDLERLMLSLFPQSHGGYIDVNPGEFRTDRENVRILYAEDSKMVRGITEKILKNSGYLHVDSFENGEDAFNFLCQRIANGDFEGNCPYDLVLTDIEMPKMDGLTLCRRVKNDICAKHPPKVIVYSSLINKEMAVKCVSVGADAQLAKPDVKEIVDLVDSLCL